MDSLRKQSPRTRLLPAVCVALLVLAAWLLVRQTRHAEVAASTVTIALPTGISVGAFYVGLNQKIFDKHGLKVIAQPFILGKDALQSVLNGKSDLAVVADVPFMFSVMHGDKIGTVATVFGSRRTMAVVALKDHGIVKAQDLRHKTVGTIFGTTAQYFLDTLLVANGIEKADVTIVNLKAGTVVEALQSGKVDAVTAWHPDLAKLQHALGDRATSIYDEDMYVYRFILIGKPDYLIRHAAEVRQVLAALDESTRFIHGQPTQAQTIFGKYIGVDESLVKEAFLPNDFYLSLDQTLLLALGNETRWAMKQGFTPAGPVPNYLDYIAQEPLKAVLPGAVKIIQ
ncbi:MAG: transporter, periplasmic substrate-binding protein NMT1/THI5-like [Rhodocyclales bacterium]|nr:transporter, periplasmic substrate-binding protein NMT1/THI5-like [Rhodocyclales bacterium]